MKSIERQPLQGEMGHKQGPSCGWVYEEKRPGTIQAEEDEREEEEEKGGKKEKKKNSATNCNKLLKAKSGLAWKYSTPGSRKYKWNLHPLAGFHQRPPPTAWEKTERRARDQSSSPPWCRSVGVWSSVAEGKAQIYTQTVRLKPLGKGSELCCTWA